MMSRVTLSIAALVTGVVAGSFYPEWSQPFRRVLNLPLVSHAEPTKAAQNLKSDGGSSSREDEKHTAIVLTQDQIKTTGIEWTPVQPGNLARRVTFQGTVIPHADRIARVSVKVSGTVAELKKKIGDPVAKGDVVAVLESRELADAKSEFLAARLTDELQQDLYARDRTLWDKRISNEQQYLKSRNAAAQSRMRLDISRQKLAALGLSPNEIAALPSEPEALLHRQDIRAPISGRVVDRKVELGMAVGRDSLETELFTIADLDRVWVELSLSPVDLPGVREGDAVKITARGTSAEAEGQIVFVSPILDKESRSARVVVEIGNHDGVWRPGTFVSGAVTLGEHQVSLLLPSSAIQTVNGEKVVFVRTANGADARKVLTGESDGRFVEISAGLQLSDVVAVSETFALKAELLKSQAED
jgi:cobalt-zinc-cadmium efflux system membrane fusion protein